MARAFEPLGDLAIGVFAPSSPFVAERFASGRARLQASGLTVQVHPQAFSKSGYLAGDDEARKAAFLDLLDDDAIGAIIAARGGYGVHRWITEVPPEALRRARKPIIGFSDVSAVHAALVRHEGPMSVHGPVVTQLADLPEADVEHLVNLLRDPAAALEVPAEGPCLVAGRATGPLYGGNLAVLAALAGTDVLRIPDGAVLLLEDVGEAPYRLDRALTQLLLAGALDGVAAVVLGDFTDCKAPRAGDPEALDVLAERLGRLGVPVLAGLPVGHGARNRALPLGRTATCDAGGLRLSFAAE